MAFPSNVTGPVGPQASWEGPEFAAEGWGQSHAGKCVLGWWESLKQEQGAISFSALEAKGGGGMSIDRNFMITAENGNFRSLHLKSYLLT